MKKALLAVLILAFSISAFAGSKITIVNNNAPGVGFNDPTPATPVGGNNGTTLGQQRLNAFQFAADVWGATLDSPVEIRILASFEPLACTANTATLGSAGAFSVFRDFGSETLEFFPGPEYPSTWYHIALANKRAGTDLSLTDGNTIPGNNIRARFNSILGNAGCLTGTFWYLGFDRNHGNNIDLVTVLLHEFAHGLGFAQFGNVSTGTNFLGLTDIYGRHLLDLTINKTWDQMSDAERQAASIDGFKVVWTGNTVNTDLPHVLSLGTPLVHVNNPAALGNFAVGTAAFGPALSNPGVTGDVVAALDPSDAAGTSTFDACSPLTNAADVAGKIALVNRGTCGFVVKVKNAQNAGAIAVLVADNAAGSPPAGLGGADPTITIPAVRITIDAGAAIRTALASGSVNATLGLDTSVYAGASADGRALMNAPSPVQPGSSISHWDPIAFPNQLMEPAINSDLTHSVKTPQDLTLSLMRDVGWFPDADNDGVPNDSDQCASSLLAPGEIVIGSCNTTVQNMEFSNGCTIRDYLRQTSVGVKNRGGYLSNVAHLGEALLNAGIITTTQKDQLQTCAATTK
jgi:hypothetical protein